MAVNPGWWLRIPGLALNLKLDVPHADLTFTRAQPKGEFRVEGRRNPVTRFGTRGGKVLALPVRCRGLAEYQQLEDALDALQVMQLDAPTGESWWVTCGDTSERWVADNSFAAKPHRVVTLNLTETDPPA